MKKTLFLLTALFLFVNVFATLPLEPSKELKSSGINSVSAFDGASQINNLQPDLKTMGINQFLSLTPKKYQELTGKKMSLKQILELKVAQKFVKKQMKHGGEMSKGLYILLAFLGVAWIAMGVMDDWSGSTWVVNLILSLLCWLPGFIHALVKMKDYYNR
jgi:uncharacterized membrane protein YqaE (UPF0057 family)